MAEGGRAEFIAADLNDIESVRRLAEQTGGVDVLVNNAATVTAAPTLEQDVESFDVMFDVLGCGTGGGESPGQGPRSGADLYHLLPGAHSGDVHDLPGDVGVGKKMLTQPPRG